MTSSNITASLVALAAFAALAMGTKRSGATLAAISAQPAQRDRDAGLVKFLDTASGQGVTWNNAQVRSLQSINHLVNPASAQ